MENEQELELLANKIKHIIIKSKSFDRYREKLEIIVFPINNKEWDIKIIKKRDIGKTTSVNLKNLIMKILDQNKELIAQEINGEVEQKND